MALRVRPDSLYTVYFLRLRTLAIGAAIFGGGVQLAQADRPATLRQVAVLDDAHDLSIEITASKPVTARTQVVTDPDRLIVDVPDARPQAGLQKVAINRGKLKDVRVGLLSANPPITRVVMDLAAPSGYRVSPSANTIVVRLGKSSPAIAAPGAASAQPPAEARPAESTPALAIPPLEPTSHRSWVRWIMPILITATILSMLVASLVVHIQNKRSRRGL